MDILLPTSGGFLLGLLFNPKSSSDTFLRNVRLPLNFTALQLKMQYNINTAISQTVTHDNFVALCVDSNMLTAS
jgi:hypothetical protein